MSAENTTLTRYTHTHTQPLTWPATIKMLAAPTVTPQTDTDKCKLVATHMTLGGPLTHIPLPTLAYENFSIYSIRVKLSLTS